MSHHKILDIFPEMLSFATKTYKLITFTYTKVEVKINPKVNSNCKDNSVYTFLTKALRTFGSSKCRMFSSGSIIITPS